MSSVSSLLTIELHEGGIDRRLTRGAAGRNHVRLAYLRDTRPTTDLLGHDHETDLRDGQCQQIHCSKRRLLNFGLSGGVDTCIRRSVPLPQVLSASCPQDRRDIWCIHLVHLPNRVLALADHLQDLQTVHRYESG